MVEQVPQQGPRTLSDAACFLLVAKIQARNFHITTVNREISFDILTKRVCPYRQGSCFEMSNAGGQMI